MSAKDNEVTEEETLSVWAKILGPVYTLPGFARRLDVEEAEVLARIQTHDVWVLTTGDGAMVFPASQLTDSNTVLAGLPEILRIFAEAGEDGWTLASVLNADWEELGDRSPLQWLREQPTDSPISVTQWAQRTVRRWSH